MSSSKASTSKNGFRLEAGKPPVVLAYDGGFSGERSDDMGGHLQIGDADKLRRQRADERAMIDYYQQDNGIRHLDLSRKSKNTLCGLDTSGLPLAQLVLVEHAKADGMVGAIECPACLYELEGQIKDDMARCRRLLKEIKDSE